MSEQTDGPVISKQKRVKTQTQVKQPNLKFYQPSKLQLMSSKIKNFFQNILPKNESKKETLSHKLFRFFVYGILSFMIVSGVVVGVTKLIKYSNDPYQNFFTVMFEESVDMKYWAAKDELCDSINNHIKKLAPNSGLEALWIVDMCDKHDVDIVLCLAQAQVESMYGTVGSAKYTNQVFNVGIYDSYKSLSDIPKHKFIQNPNRSIETYCEVIRNNYLGENKTSMDLLDNFVNLSGKRYASNESYEKMLISVYNNIQSKLGNSIDVYNKYKMLTNR